MSYFNQPPAFAFRQWPCFLNPDLITYLGLALFIMCITLAEYGHDLFKFRMSDTASYSYNDGFFHLVRNNFANAKFAMPACCLLFRHGLEYNYLASGCWRKTDNCVSTLAIPRLRSRKREGFSSWLLAFWSFRLKSSCRISRPLATNSAWDSSTTSENFTAI